MKYQIGIRIKQLRENAGLNQTEFAEMIGASNSRVSNWEKGINRPDVDLLSKICETLNVSADELLELNNDISLNSKEQKMINLYRELSYNGKCFLDSLMDKVVEYDSLQKSNIVSESSPIIYRPVYDIKVSAGTGQFLDSDQFEIKAFPAADVPPDSTFGVVIAGDSMEPTYHDKQTVFAKQDPDIRSGDIGIFVLDGEGYIKQLVKTENSCVLRSFNKNYKDIKIKDYTDMRIVGKVVGKL